MLVLLRPDRAVRDRIQNSEAWIYWSGLAGMFLRKHGFIFRETEGALPTDGGFIVATRGAAVDSSGSVPAGLYEGPIDAELLARLGIRARLLRAESVGIRILAEPWMLNGANHYSGLGYSSDIVRRIPASRTEISDPYVYAPEDPLLSVRPVPLQIFDAPPEWRVIAHAMVEGETGDLPIIITDGRVTLTGIPLFDIAVRKHWLPPLDAGYYTAGKPVGMSREAQWWLAHLIRTAATTANESVLMLDHWPDGRQAALTIRLDHDRPIKKESLDDLLNFFSDNGLLASWGFLVRLAPTEVTAAVMARGHEIVLHTEAPDFASFRSEIAHFRKQGISLSGVTAHGGIGSAGHLGQTLFDWARHERLMHADTQSRENLLPHPMLAVHNQKLTAEDFFLPGLHRSLDLGTKPDAHQLPHLMNLVPILLKAGEHVTIMNHPDIHRSELKTALTPLARPEIWRATHAQVVDWCRSVKFGWSLKSDGAEPTVAVASHLIGAIRLRCFGPGNHEVEPRARVEPVQTSGTHNAPDRIAQKADAALNATANSQSQPGDNKNPSMLKTSTTAGTGTNIASSKSNGSRQVVAVYTAAPARLDADLNAMGALGAQITESEIRTFTVANGKFWFPYDRNEFGSVLVPPPIGFFDTLVLGQSIRLFNNAWGASLIAHAARTLRPNGRLIVWFNKAAKPQGLWRLADLEEFLGTAAVETVDNHAVFVLDRSPVPPQSVLTWFFSSFSELILRDMTITKSTSTNYDELGDPLLDGIFTIPGQPAEALLERLVATSAPNKPQDFNPQDFLREVISEHSYLIYGISYKSALINGIIREHFPQGAGLRHCDLGGSYGLLAAELLLDQKCPIESALNVDFNPRNLLLGAKLYLGNRRRLGGKFRFWLGPMEHYPFDERFDVITMLASLVYVPVKHRESVLKRAWESLAPGGILIIHENIKSPKFPEYNYMFTVEELDAMLGKYGPIDRYLSTTIRKVSQDAAADRTVFRVIKKLSA